MHCKRCLEISKYTPGYHIQNVPTTGRASKNRLCCKHDRELYGKQGPEEQGEKQRQIAIRKAWYRFGV